MSLNLNLGDYKRRNSVPVKIGDVSVGGSFPIAVQSMTNTDTADASTTTKQIIDLANAGSEIVRVTVDREDSAKMIPYIKEKLLKADWLNADKIRGKYNDWDFTKTGIIRQVRRMKDLAKKSKILQWDSYLHQST